MKLFIGNIIYIAVALGVAAMVYQIIQKMKSIERKDFDQWERDNREDFARTVRSRREQEAVRRQSATTKYEKEESYNSRTNKDYHCSSDDNPIHNTKQDR